MPPEITATVIALDAADTIEAALSSVAWADHRLVLDSGSMDDTPDRARRCGAEVVRTDWPGYGAQKNRAAELAPTDWILSLDADERVGGELAESIASLPRVPGVAAYRVRRRNRLRGRPIRHWPWAWDEPARLYDRRRARFTCRRVHETLEMDGAVATLSGVLEHDAYRDWDDYRRRQERYARLGARELADRGRRPRPGDLGVRPLATWLRHMLGRGYVVGGPLAWRMSREAARGTRAKYQALRELQDDED